MITRENIYENREYITQINRTRIFFTFPDGKQEHADNPPAETVKDLLAYFTEEWQFYARTVDLLRNEYDKRKAALDRKKKFYTVEEIEKADLFDSASMKVHNEELHREYQRVFGLGDLASCLSDKEWKLYKLNGQCKEVLSIR